MKDRPILYSTEMVGAIVDKIKLKTRRTKGLEVINENPGSWEFTHCTASDGDLKQFLFRHVGVANRDELIACPYGKPGDLLWVRESWRMVGWDYDDGEMLIEYKDGQKLWVPIYDPTEDSAWVVKYVENLWMKGCLAQDPEDADRAVFVKEGPWKPSIHMPKEAARIWLKIEDIQPERLQDITEEDAVAEGIFKAWPLKGKWKNYLESDKPTKLPEESFRTLWQSINGIESWYENPWVWVIGFELLSTEGRPDEEIKETECGDSVG